MNELKVNLENLTTEERRQLTTLLEKSQNPKKVGTWFPKEYEIYWCIDHCGVHIYKYTKHVVDLAVFDIQDPCKTEEEAQRKLEQQKAVVQVNRQVRDIIAKGHPDWVCDWNDCCQSKFYPYFDHVDGKRKIGSALQTQTQFLFEYAPNGVWERIDETLIRKAMGV